MNQRMKKVTTGIAGALAVITVSPHVAAHPVLTFESTAITKTFTDFTNEFVDGRFEKSITEGYVVEAIAPLRSASAIHKLCGKHLSQPISVLIEPDDEMFLARSPDVPQVYGHADTPSAAHSSLVDNIEGLLEELNSDDEFTDEWLLVRDYLNGIVKA